MEQQVRRSRLDGEYASSSGRCRAACQDVGAWPGTWVERYGWLDVVSGLWEDRWSASPISDEKRN